MPIGLVTFVAVGCNSTSLLREALLPGMIAIHDQRRLDQLPLVLRQLRWPRADHRKKFRLDFEKLGNNWVGGESAAHPIEQPNVAAFVAGRCH